jgi:hypothetical protein
VVVRQLIRRPGVERLAAQEHSRPRPRPHRQQQGRRGRQGRRWRLVVRVGDAKAAGSAKGDATRKAVVSPSPLPPGLLAVGAGATPVLLRLSLPHTAVARDGNGPPAGPGLRGCQQRGEGRSHAICRQHSLHTCTRDDAAVQQRDAITQPQRACEMRAHIDGPLAAAVARIRPRARIQHHASGVQVADRPCDIKRADPRSSAA